MAATSERWSRHLAALLVGVCAVAVVNAPADAAPARAAHTPHDTPNGTPRLTGAQRAVLLDATRRFRDVRRAITAGYLPTRDCMPGMGFHYVNPALAGDPNIDPTRPEVLVYTAAGGKARLAALEYFRADADQNLETDQDRPTLFGHPFNGPMPGHPLPPGRPPMPIHYDLHVWLYQNNPSGEFATTNPQVDCH
ncbi:hypothetical protein [Actinoplanes subtropicus]|uniref:hypothetical protein n=1 Tax=Actinoplanes subtropicus TaxID=543632 RepID=UPI0004C2E258|nr:hypothetical protein [Actinoplanes subtropicus]